ncbi:hypothetical protein B0T18DRAFT_424190 [Schizothecium vesticola]|uniref:G domain-containing protein n=1 Tax=Schizothecium vesticola TaxID=314040 RepID=A0AA40F9I2_9PEZI|nr:hypothetical protein B0T18DRAFT_424190 [Schizothecium vesticola]
MSKKFVILLIGPARCGKTTFLKFLGANVGNGPTTTCSAYEVPSTSGNVFTVVDTPGLDSSPKTNLAVLKIIADKLSEMTKGELMVSGVIYFHCITDMRLTGTARTHIEILSEICGKHFYPRIAFVTTMWNRIKAGDRTYERLHGSLGQKYTHIVRPHMLFRFSNDRKSAEAVLEHFNKPYTPVSRAELQLEVEVRQSGSGASAVRKTKAGRRIDADLDKGFCVIL